jgi:hypothetical protein
MPKNKNKHSNKKYDKIIKEIKEFIEQREFEEALSLIKKNKKLITKTIGEKGCVNIQNTVTKKQERHQSIVKTLERQRHIIKEDERKDRQKDRANKIQRKNKENEDRRYGLSYSKPKIIKESVEKAAIVKIKKLIEKKKYKGALASTKKEYSEGNMSKRNYQKTTKEIKGNLNTQNIVKDRIKAYTKKGNFTKAKEKTKDSHHLNKEQKEKVLNKIKKVQQKYKISHKSSPSHSISSRNDFSDSSNYNKSSLNSPYTPNSSKIESHHYGRIIPTRRGNKSLSYDSYSSSESSYSR